jgi:malate synthase
VPVCKEVFDGVLGNRPNQKERLREEVHVEAEEMIRPEVPGGSVTEEGIRNNISVTLQYINSWLNGTGAAAIFNLMEDAATAEISRSQLWQWVRHGATTGDGQTVDAALYEALRDEELAKLGGEQESRYRDAREILDSLVLSEEYAEFLTLPAYERLERS